MSALAEELRAYIRAEGPIPVERWMALCLGHPSHGYYMTRDPFGETGDFTTAPEISQMFGELLGLWAGQVWLDQGAPPRVHLVECGPGRGTLMADALRAARVLPPFMAAINVHLVETSPVLRSRQEQALALCDVPLSWHETLETLPTDGPLIILANEFLDALPVRQYQNVEGGWHERMVGLENTESADERFVFKLNPAPEAALKRPAPEGAIIEVAIPAIVVLRVVAERLRAQGGAAVFIDYGHDQSGIGDTLQAVSGHAFVNPLENPGEADLTTHVDFAAMARIARGNGLITHGPIAQATFLSALGMDERATVLARNKDQRAEVEAAQRRLMDTSPKGMGALFKVLAMTPPGAPTPPGFVVM
jgi:NADH dehydrogenase [ubiquinone] 1 alpha subcomplex assembly factor 7